jgi:uncharacterized protein
MLIIIVLTILFCAAFIKATLGFGEALLAMPLLTLVLGVQAASPLIGLVGTSLSMLILCATWRSVDLRASWRLVLAAVLGVPIGVWGLAILPAAWVTVCLGMVLIVASFYNLSKPSLRTLESPHWAWPFGFAAGILGGAYNTSGPPLVLYGSFRRWTSDQFQATLQSCFLPTSIVKLLGHGIAGLWTAQVLWFYIISLPVVLAAYWLGSRFSRTMPTERFKRLVDVGVVVLGFALVIQSFSA